MEFERLESVISDGEGKKLNLEDDLRQRRAVSRQDRLNGISVQFPCPMSDYILDTVDQVSACIVVQGSGTH